MMTAMNVFVILFLVLNTISFYLMDSVSDKFLEKPENIEIDPTELSVYVFLRVLVKICVIGMCITIPLNIYYQLVN
jgi:hypothetical protein